MGGGWGWVLCWAGYLWARVLEIGWFLPAQE